MSAVQRLLASVLPGRWAAAMERESREWRIECPACAADGGSVWARGGVRWLAAGSPRVAGRCRSCGGMGLQLVRRRGMQ